MKNHILESVKSAIRNPYAWPGGYPVYTVCADGELLCCDCARKNYRQIVKDTTDGTHDSFECIGAQIYWEGQTEYCSNCNKELESAYGNPDNEEEEAS